MGSITQSWSCGPGPIQNNHAFKQPLNHRVWILIPRPNIFKTPSRTTFLDPFQAKNITTSAPKHVNIVVKLCTLGMRTAAQILSYIDLCTTRAKVLMLLLFNSFKCISYS